MPPELSLGVSVLVADITPVCSVAGAHAAGLLVPARGDVLLLHVVAVVVPGPIQSLLTAGLARHVRVAVNANQQIRLRGRWEVL